MNFIIYKMKIVYAFQYVKILFAKIDLAVAVMTDCAAVVFLTVIVDCLVFHVIL